MRVLLFEKMVLSVVVLLVGLDAVETGCHDGHTLGVEDKPAFFVLSRPD